MFEQDYIMRLIREMVRTLLKLLFHMDADPLSQDFIPEGDTQNTLSRLLAMTDTGQINEAENHIYGLTYDKDMEHLKLALAFYSYLNEKEDYFLREHGYSREEIQSGIKDLLSRYGISGDMVDLFIM